LGKITCGGVLDSTNLMNPELQAVEAWSPLKIFKAKRNDKKVVYLDDYRKAKKDRKVVSIAEYRREKAQREAA